MVLFVLGELTSQGVNIYNIYRDFRLRRYVTNRKVAGSRPDEVNDFYQVT
jgi:hypothetical protein